MRSWPRFEIHETMIGALALLGAVVLLRGLFNNVVATGAYLLVGVGIALTCLVLYQQLQHISTKSMLVNKVVWLLGFVLFSCNVAYVCVKIVVTLISFVFDLCVRDLDRNQKL